MADKERVRLRKTFAELLSPAVMSQTARGTITDHDEPVVGGSVKGQAGQELANLTKFSHNNFKKCQISQIKCLMLMLYSYA